MRQGAGPVGQPSPDTITTAVRLVPRRVSRCGGGLAVVMLETNSFWADPRQWPRDPHGYVFLARAVHEIGKAKYGNDWSGQEPVMRLEQVLPLLPSSNLSDKCRAHDLLLKHRPELGRKQLRFTRYGPPEIEFTQEEWDAAREISKRLSDDTIAPVTRFHQIQADIVNACESGELIAFIRPKAGGDMKAIPKEWWNTDRWNVRFVLCQLDPENPFSIGSAGDRYCWIFFSREGLTQFLNIHVSGNFNLPTSMHLSPYLMVMLATATKLDVTPEHQPKHEAIVAEIIAAWTMSKLLSKRLADSMATLIREPESQLGRARPDPKSQRRGRRKK